MQRIEEFLKEDEVPDWASTLSSDSVDPITKQGGEMEIGFSDASFEWKESSCTDVVPSRFHLGPLDVMFPAGKLTIVSGATGSGKSAFLVALLGGKLSFYNTCNGLITKSLIILEMHCTAGKVLIDKTNHQVAYCAQNSCQSLVAILSRARADQH